MGWNIDGERPVWIQLKEHLAKQIVSGQYQCGERMPSVRDLASEAGVNPNTMQRALAALDQEGLTATSRTSGRKVTENSEKIETCRSEFAHRIMERYLKEMAELGYTKSQAAGLIEKEDRTDG